MGSLGLSIASSRQMPALLSNEANSWLAEFDDLEQAGAFLFAMNRFLFVARKPGCL